MLKRVTRLIIVAVIATLTCTFVPLIAEGTPLSITFNWSVAGGTFTGPADNNAFTATVSLVANSGMLTLEEGQSVSMQIQDWSWSVNVNAVGTAQYPADRLLTIDGIAQTIDQDFRLPVSYSSYLGYVKAGRLMDSTVLTYDFGPRGKVDVKLLNTQTPSTFTTGTSAYGLISQGRGAVAQFTAYHMVLEPALLGDLNNDNVLNNQDIASFVLALTDLSAWQALYPTVNILSVGDLNGDLEFDNQDIAPFVTLLTAGGTVLSTGDITVLNTIPEPATLSFLAIGGLIVLGQRRSRSDMMR